MGYRREELLSLGLEHFAPDALRYWPAREAEGSDWQRLFSQSFRTVHRCRDGQEMPVEWLLRALPARHSRLVMIVARPVAPPPSTETFGEEPSLLDPLTGLANRLAFDRRLVASLTRARHCRQYQFAVLFIDLDDFKPVNDTLGHLRGDLLLKEVARRLGGCVRPGDMVSRRGGDEFTVLVDNLQDPRDAIGVAERVGAQLAQPLDLGACSASITASIGIAIGSCAYECPERLLHDADRAMYRAKSTGKGCHVVFDEETCADFNARRPSRR